MRWHGADRSYSPAVGAFQWAAPLAAGSGGLGHFPQPPPRGWQVQPLPLLPLRRWVQTRVELFPLLK